jgi:hypothetical protein
VEEYISLAPLYTVSVKKRNRKISVSAVDVDVFGKNAYHTVWVKFHIWRSEGSYASIASSQIHQP